MVTGRRQIWLLAGAKYDYWQPPDMVAGKGIISDRGFLLIGIFSESLGIFLNCQSLSFESLLRIKKYQVRNNFFSTWRQSEGHIAGFLVILHPENFKNTSISHRFLIFLVILHSENFKNSSISHRFLIFCNFRCRKFQKQLKIVQIFDKLWV